MARYERSDWARLGQAVYEARTEAGLGKTIDWVESVQRSSRVLLGLERGEKVGTGTLEAIEDALAWPRGGCYRVLTGGVDWRNLGAGPPPEVTSAEDVDELTLERLAAEVAGLRRQVADLAERAAERESHQRGGKSEKPGETA